MAMIRGIIIWITIFLILGTSCSNLTPESSLSPEPTSDPTASILPPVGSPDTADTPSPCATAAPAPTDSANLNYLYTEGNRILDAAGREVRITGINWFGLETSTFAPHGLDQRRWCDLLDQIAALGFNAIRIPFSNQLLDPDSVPTGIDLSLNPDLEDLSGIEIMDRIIAGARDRGLKVILDRHRPDAHGQSELWYTDAYPEERWLADWEMLTRRYLDDDTVIGFDLHNEPHGAACWGCGDPATDWRLAAERAGNAILAVNPNLLIIVEGVERYNGDYCSWGGNLKGAQEYPVRLDVPNHLVYSAHDYGPGVYPQPWFDARDFPQNLVRLWDEHWGYINRLGIAPVLVGEFGGRSVGTDTEGIWQRTLVSYLRANGLHYTYWTLNPDSGDTGGLLLDDWSAVDQTKHQLLSTYQFPKIEQPTLQLSEDFLEKLTSLCWVAFAPTNQDPNTGIIPDDESLRADLYVLREAGFTGLVTYAADERTHRLAAEADFEAMIMGIWDPTSAEELRLAQEAAASSIVIGYVVGNEGLNQRYDFPTLQAAIDQLYQATGKPVTTTEESGDYDDPLLLNLGHWVFPNVHPYWANYRNPSEAVAWTATVFDELHAQAGNRPVLFKEVGLPTAGDTDVDEQRQAEYYRQLQATPVHFVYFEAFDQPWKDWAPVEPHWGLFRSDRLPKEVTQYVCGKNP